MISHHLTDLLMADYVAGRATPAVETLVAAHLTLCPTCRARVDELEAVGGTLFENLPEAALAEGALDRMLARLDTAEPVVAPPASAAEIEVTDGILLPWPLRRLVGADLGALPWQRLLRGIDRTALDLEAGAGSVFLLRARPSATLPHHSHEGSETAMVLTGGYTHARGHFLPGDVDVADTEVEHSLRADPGEDCHILVVLEGALRFTGRYGRLLNPR